MNDTTRRGGLDLATIVAAPKVLLHDHLDGGLRPRTVIELARDGGYDGLPTSDPDASAWFRRGADRKSLELYLAGFAHTVGVMQTPEALERVAAECAEDFANDGIVYAEVRFAPELHLEQGMSLDAVVEAVLRGFRRGSGGTADRASARCGHAAPWRCRAGRAPSRRRRGGLRHRRR
jgi:adenosine deaminase